MALREASAQELLRLWQWVAADDFVAEAFDGRRRCAFLLDFCRQGQSELYPGVAGAIVHAEEGQGPIAAWFYGERALLGSAWAAVAPPLEAN